VKNKKSNKKIRGKVVYGLTAEERFKEIHGMTIEEWHEEQFIMKTGMTTDEWYIQQVKSKSPIDFFKERNGNVTEDEVKLISELQEIGLNNDVIHVLLDYVSIISRSIGLFHPLVKKMGENWHEKNISTLEKAIVFVREEQKKYNDSTDK
jgi:replication initiation and membrane attachment protein DnaB